MPTLKLVARALHTTVTAKSLGDKDSSNSEDPDDHTARIFSEGSDSIKKGKRARKEQDRRTSEEELSLSEIEINTCLEAMHVQVATKSTSSRQKELISKIRDLIEASLMHSRNENQDKESREAAFRRWAPKGVHERLDLTRRNRGSRQVISFVSPAVRPKREAKEEMGEEVGAEVEREEEMVENDFVPAEDKSKVGAEFEGPALQEIEKSVPKKCRGSFKFVHNGAFE